MTTASAKITTPESAEPEFSATRLWVLRKQLNKNDRQELDALFKCSDDTRYKWLRNPELIPVGILHELVEFLDAKYPLREINVYTLLEKI